MLMAFSVVKMAQADLEASPFRELSPAGPREHMMCVQVHIRSAHEAPLILIYDTFQFNFILSSS